MFVSLAGPTSPAYSCCPGVRTEPGCFADRSFSTQAYKPRVLTDITRLRVAVPKTSFFCCLHLSSIRVSRSFPHRLADVRISVSTCFIRCYGVARGVLEDGGATGSGRGLPLERAGTAHAAFRPLDPTLIAQCFFLIGRRPVACSAIVLRLALREGRPISRARLLFYPAIRVDSPTSPAVACSVRRQLSLHVERRAPRYESERTALVVAAPALVFETATSAPLRVATHHGHPSATYSFADATMRRRRVRCPPLDSVDGHDGAADARLGELSGAQRGHWGARTSLTSSTPRSTLLRLVYVSFFQETLFSHLYHTESGLFTQFASGGLQRPQTTFTSCW